MRPILLVFFLFFSVHFVVGQIPAKEKKPQSYKSIKYDNTFWRYQMDNLIVNYPNRSMIYKAFVKIDSVSPKRKIERSHEIYTGINKVELKTDNGTVTRVRDSLYIITPERVGPINFWYKGMERYKFKRYAEPFPQPQIRIKGTWKTAFTLEELIKAGAIEAYHNSYYEGGTEDKMLLANQKSLYKITSFSIGVYGNGANFRAMSWSCQGDSFVNILTKGDLKYLAQNIGEFFFKDIIVIAPDGSMKKVDKYEVKVYRNPSDALLHNCLEGFDSGKASILSSNIRIQFKGDVSEADSLVLEEAMAEYNKLTKLNIKRVNRNPTLVIDFKKEGEGENVLSLTPIYGFSYSKNRSEEQHIDVHIREDKLNKTIIKSVDLWEILRFFMNVNPNHFFPEYQHGWVTIRSTNVNARAAGIWKGIFMHLGAFKSESTDSSSIFSNAYCVPGLAKWDKEALSYIFSDEGKHKIANPLPINNRLFFIILVTLVFLFIGMEIKGYFNFRWLRNPVVNWLVASLFMFAVVVVSLIAEYKIFRVELSATGLLPIALLCFILTALWFLCDYLLKKQKRGWVALTLDPLITFLGLLLSYHLFSFILLGYWYSVNTANPNLWIIAMSFIAVRFGIRYQKVKVGTLLQEKEYELTKQKEMKLKAELNALQARINPHFLYNALNSVAALAHIDANRTEKMALQLSKLFRYNLNREEQLTTSLGQEIEMVQLYLDIEKQRFGEKLTFTITIDDGLADAKIPRFLIQPLVENAIKHGTSQITGAGIIKLNIFMDDNQLVIEIFDNGPAFPDGLLSGYGLQNIYEKLDLIYKKPYSIKFINTPEKLIRITLNNFA